LNRCEQIRNAGLGHLGQIFQTLKSLKDVSLNFEKCDGITDNGVEYLKEGLENVTSLRNISFNFGLSVFIQFSH